MNKIDLKTLKKETVEGQKVKDISFRHLIAESGEIFDKVLRKIAKREMATENVKWRYLPTQEIEFYLS